MGILFLICLVFTVNTKTLIGYFDSHYLFTSNMDESSPLGLVVSDYKGKVRINDVLDYTPAQNSGIEPGDRILKVNGCKVCDVKAFREQLDEIAYGEPVDLVVYRVDSCSTFPVQIYPFGTNCK